MDTKKKSSEILVKFSDVTKQYGDLVVLDKLNLEIKKNEMVSIIGPSGSGKTTVLRVLMTLEKINQGIIHLDGEPLTHMLEKEKLVFANEKYLRERRSKITEIKSPFFTIKLFIRILSSLSKGVQSFTRRLRLQHIIRCFLVIFILITCLVFLIPL